MVEPAIKLPPSVDELPTDDGEPMESERHKRQMDLLIEQLDVRWADRDDRYVGGNMAFYFSALQAKNQDFRAPDVLIATDVPYRERKAWVVWEEDGRVPDVIIELLSESTEKTDRTTKKAVYERLNVYEYYLFDPFSKGLDGFRLDPAKKRYVPIEPNASGRLPSTRLGLELGLWDGAYRRLETEWLRWFQPDGTVLPHTFDEVHVEKARADEAEARADEAEARADEAEARLAAMAKKLEALERGSS